MQRIFTYDWTTPPMTAKSNKFDVVLIDTAGRMQDNEPLMRALAKVCGFLLLFLYQVLRVPIASQN